MDLVVSNQEIDRKRHRDFEVEGRPDYDRREGRFSLYIGGHYFGGLDADATHPGIGWQLHWEDSRKSLKDLLGTFEQVAGLLGFPQDLSNDDDLSGLWLRIRDSEIWHDFHFGKKEPKLDLSTYLPNTEGISDEIRSHVRKINDNPDLKIEDFNFYYRQIERRDFDWANYRQGNEGYHIIFEGRGYFNNESLGGRNGWFNFLSGKEDMPLNSQLIDWIIENHEHSNLFRGADSSEIADKINTVISSTLNPTEFTHLIIRNRAYDPEGHTYLSFLARDYDSCISYEDARTAFFERLRSEQACSVGLILDKEGYVGGDHDTNTGFPPSIDSSMALDQEYVLVQDVTGYFRDVGGHVSRTIFENYPTEEALLTAFHEKQVPNGWDAQERLYAVQLLPDPKMILADQKRITQKQE